MNLLVFPTRPRHSLSMSRFRAPILTLRHVYRALTILTLFATLLTPQMATATVVVPVADRDMTQQASIIVIGKITKLKSSWDKNHQQIFTKITLSVDEVLKGNLKKRRLTVTQFGGVVDDVEAWIDGNAQFTEGEKVLLFLDRQENGRLGVLHLYQGKFSIFTDPETGAELAYREAHPEGVQVLPEDHASERRAATEADGDSATLTDNGFFPLADLKARIRNALTNPSLEPLPQTPAPSSNSSQTFTLVTREEAPFALLGSPAARWFEGDTNLPVSMRVNLSLSPAGAGTAVQAALNAWTGVSGSSFKFQNAGSTTSAGMVYDGVNAISFGDPRGQITPPSRSTYVNPTTRKPYCSGVLAIGGYYRSGSEADTKIINGQKYYKIGEGDLVFADGWENCHNGFDNSLNVAEVTTHELGHVIGLGHSADSTATMYAYAHFDNRGASLRADDIVGLKAIYPRAGTITSPPPTTSTCTYALSATGLAVGSAAGTGNVTLTASANTCSWTAASNVSWITVTSGTNGTGSKTVTLSIAANTSSVIRTATLTIAGKSVTVTQAGVTQSTSCSVSAPTFPTTITANTTRLSITISASSSTCGWTASSPVSWVTVYSGSPNRGTATVTFLIAANPSRLARTTTLTIAGKPVTITQRGKLQ